MRPVGPVGPVGQLQSDVDLQLSFFLQLISGPSSGHSIVIRGASAIAKVDVLIKIETRVVNNLIVGLYARDIAN